MWIMQFVVVSLAVLTIFDLGAQGQQNPQHRIEITTSEPTGVVYPGKNVSITCRLIGMPDNTLFMLKKGAYIDIITNPISEDIATNTILSTFYSRLGRFALRKTTENDDILYTLEITGVKLEDSGYYGCTARVDANSDVVYNMAEFAVYRPPTEVLHNQNDSYIAVQEGEQILFDCKAPRIYPYPDFEIVIANRDDRESVNPNMHVEDHPQPPTKEMVDSYRNKETEKWRFVNENFLVETQTNLYCTENPAQKDCSLHLDYTMIARHTDRHKLIASYEYHGKFLTCVVTMRELLRDSVNTSVLLSVEFSPRINCEAIKKGSIEAKLNASDFYVQCNVQANPIPSTSWIEGPCSSSTVIPENSEEYAISEKPLVPDETNRDVKLAFRRNLQNKYFQTKYCLRVKNDKDTAQVEFKLEKVSGAVRMASVGLLYISTCFLAFFLPY